MLDGGVRKAVARSGRRTVRGALVTIGSQRACGYGLDGMGPPGCWWSPGVWRAWMSDDVQTRSVRYRRAMMLPASAGGNRVLDHGETSSGDRPIGTGR